MDTQTSVWSRIQAPTYERGEEALRGAFARGPATLDALVRGRAAAPAPARAARRAICLTRGHSWRPVGHDEVGVVYGCLRCGDRHHS
jgi:hypothetical protein